MACRRSIPLVALALVVLAFVASGAQVARAAAPWSDPTTISTPRAFADLPALAFGTDGRALAWWRAGDGAPDTLTASAAPGGTFGAPRAAPSGRVAPQPYGASRVLTLAEQVRADETRLQAVTGRTDGSFDRPRTIDTHVAYGAAALGVDPADGAASAAWVARERSARVVRAALRPAGGRFAAPVTLQAAGKAGPAVAAAAGHRGDAVVAWERDGRIEARVRRGRGAFGAVQSLGPAARGTQVVLRVALAPTGRAIVAWGSQQLSEGGPAGGYSVRAAVLPAGQRRFRVAVQLFAGDPQAGADAGPYLAVTRDGTASVAYTAPAQAGATVLVATTDATARFGASVPVSPAGAVAGGVAAAADGAVVVTWTTNPDGGSIGAALRPAGGAFGAPEVVSAEEQARVSSPAFDPATGRPSIVWSARPTAASPPQTVIRTATRTG